MNFKKSFLIILVMIGITTMNVNAMAKGDIKITIKYKCSHIVEGYDHISRLKVYVDGNVAGTSTEKLESQQNSITIQISKGQHSLRAVLESKYEGAWEEHTIANTYSIDCLYEVSKQFKKNTMIILDFDIDVGTVIKKQ